MQSRSQIAYPEGGGGALPQSGWTNKVILNDSPFGVLAWVYCRRRGGARRRTSSGRWPTLPQVRGRGLPDAKGRLADAAALRLNQFVCAGVPYRLSTAHSCRPRLNPRQMRPSPLRLMAKPSRPQAASWVSWRLQ